MTADVFVADPAAAKPAADANQPSGEPTGPTPASGSALDQLVGEGKKFATVEDLAAGKLHSDSHIVTLTSELSEIRADLDGRLNVADMLKELKEVQIGSKQGQPEATAPGLDADQVAELVKSTVTNLDVEGRKAANRVEASNLMLTAWGDEAATKLMLQQKAQQLGVSTAFLQSAAEQSPSAFATLVGITGSPDTRGANHPGPGDVANQGVGAGDGGGPTGHAGALTENDWAWWQKLRKDDPKRYHSGEMHRRKHELVRQGALVLPKR